MTVFDTGEGVERSQSERAFAKSCRIGIVKDLFQVIKDVESVPFVGEASIDTN